METSYRFVIADDHPLFRGALREALSGLFSSASISEAGTFDDASMLVSPSACESTRPVAHAMNRLATQPVSNGASARRTRR